MQRALTGAGLAMVPSLAAVQAVSGCWWSYACHHGRAPSPLTLLLCCARSLSWAPRWLTPARPLAAPQAIASIVGTGNDAVRITPIELVVAALQLAFADAGVPVQALLNAFSALTILG